MKVIIKIYLYRVIYEIAEYYNNPKHKSITEVRVYGIPNGICIVSRETNSVIKIYHLDASDNIKLSANKNVSKFLLC